MDTTLIRVRNTILHVLVLCVLFVLSLGFFEHQINRSVPDAAADMEESSFPLVYMNRNGVNFNCLKGYTQEMDPARMRDCITPLSADRQIGLHIQLFSAKIDSLSYEVLSRDGNTTLENTQIIKYEQDEDGIDTVLTLQGKMLMNEEYVLKINLVSGGRQLSYYTDVLLSDGLHTDDYLNFVSGFYDKTVNRSDLDSVGAAVEPDDTTDIEATLAYMDIHDSVDQLTWASLHPQIFYKPTPKIKEINTKTASLTLEYRIAAVAEGGITEIYNVNEFYRVRFTDSRVFLLNFERTTDEVFNPENDVLSEKGIRLGITGKEVQYESDPKNRVVAFVQENELWTYENSSSKLTRIFGFPQNENMDLRDFADESDIRILRVNTEGDVWFAVGGYMNRGSHEGENGVALYFYDAGSALVEEQVFLTSTQGGELVRRDLEKLAYVTEDASLFYLYLEEQLWKVRLMDRTFESAAGDIRVNCCEGAHSGRYFAWLEEGNIYDSSVLCWTDLEDGVIRKVECREGERIRPLAYMENDLVYGLAGEEAIAAGSLELGLFPMYCLKIMNGEGETVKTYEPAGYLITKVSQSSHMLKLQRVSYSADKKSLKEAAEDEIVSTDTSSSVALGIATAESARKQNQVYLRVGSTITSSSPNVVNGKLVKNTSSRRVSIPKSTDYEDLLSVYAYGKLQDVFTYANEAVAEADSMVGVVTDNLRSYIWVRGARETTADIPLEEVSEVTRNLPDLFRQGNVPENGTVLDLQGCTLDEVLYFISHGYPVAAVTGTGTLTITGYDEYNTHLLDPGAYEWRYYGINDSTELFAHYGNRFFVWIPDESLQEQPL